MIPEKKDLRSKLRINDPCSHTHTPSRRLFFCTSSSSTMKPAEIINFQNERVANSLLNTANNHIYLCVYSVEYLLCWEPKHPIASFKRIISFGSSHCHKSFVFTIIKCKNKISNERRNIKKIPRFLDSITFSISHSDENKRRPMHSLLMVESSVCSARTEPNGSTSVRAPNGR